MLSHIVEQKPDCTFAIISGEYTDLIELEESFESVLKVAATANQPKVLMDLRPIRGEPRASERFLFGEWLAQICSSHLPTIHFQIACIGRFPFISRERYAETVFRNRGGQGLETDSPEEAVEWLGVELPDELTGINRKY